MAFVPLEPEDTSEKLRALFGPGMVDSTIRQAIRACWMMLPPDKNTPDEIESTIRGLVDRALKDFRDDSQTFLYKQ